MEPLFKSYQPPAPQSWGEIKKAGGHPQFPRQENFSCTSFSEVDVFKVYIRGKICQIMSKGEASLAPTAGLM